MSIMNKLNILVVHNYYQLPGGEDTAVANEIKMLKKNGNKVLFYGRHNNELKKFPFLKKIFLPFVFVFNPKTYIDVKKIIRKNHIHIVHVHNTLSLISPAVYYAALRCNVPVVQTVHNFRLICPGAILFREESICEKCIQGKLFPSVARGCYRNSRLQTLACVFSLKLHSFLGIYKKIKYVCLTDFNRNKFSFLKVPKKNFYVKPNFVENDAVYDSEKNRKNQYVYLGRLEEVKGVSFLLEAWKAYNDADCELLIVGNGPMEDWCKSFSHKYKLNVVFAGQVSHEQALNILSESKCLIFPSKLYEGLPMSIIEAFSVGTPVICPDFGNAGTLVQDGYSGFKYVQGSKESLFLALDKLKNSRELYENCRREYEQKYSEAKNYRLLMDIYDRILRERDSGLIS